MTKIKNYWDEIKNKETFYCGNGWEVHYNSEIGNDGKKRFYWQWPFYTGDGVKREDKSKCRKEVLFVRFKEKALASISTNRDEYQDLRSRVSDLSEEEFRELINNSGLKGFELRNYIQTKYWTSSESFASFWRC